MSKIIELNITEIDTVVGGISRGDASMYAVATPNKTMMALPSETYSASFSRPASPTLNTADLQARLDARRF